MKLIGVEFRVAIHNHVYGPRQYEVFLHPTDLDNGMHHNNEVIKQTLERFEEKYFAKSPQRP